MVDCTDRDEVTNLLKVYGNLSCLSPMSMWVVLFIFSGIMFTAIHALKVKSKNPLTDKDGKKVGGDHKSLKYLWVYFIILTGLSFVMMLLTHLNIPLIKSQVLTFVMIVISIGGISYIIQYIFQKDRIYTGLDLTATTGSANTKS
jgi:heme/copper-type cytochrome/quinol oxidase subunit 2